MPEESTNKSVRSGLGSASAIHLLAQGFEKSNAGPIPHFESVASAEDACIPDVVPEAARRIADQLIRVSRPSFAHRAAKDIQGIAIIQPDSPVTSLVNSEASFIDPREPKDSGELVLLLPDGKTLNLRPGQVWVVRSRPGRKPRRGGSNGSLASAS
jgi:hypothetical protein